MCPCALEMGRLPEQGDRSCETRGPLIIQSGWVVERVGLRGGGVEYKQAFFSGATCRNGVPYPI